MVDRTGLRTGENMDGTEGQEATCRWCSRAIVYESGWVDPEATGDDRVWRETCDAHDTFIAEHEPITRATAEDAGCWIDGHWGQYGLAHLIAKAEEYGYPNTEDIRIAHKHLASMGPSTKPDLTPDEEDQLIQAWDDVPEWLNTHVAPEGFSFGWHEGEFFLWSEETWEEGE